ncbi:MAG: monovalent cation/H(+) antiporter subunit G [Lachnospiraceae bacterium]|nr:monovalent cation/H(+) antiporter subunit G [Lachnospiraceae bacterium]
MAVIEWIQFLAGGLLLLIGLVIFLIQMIGVFRFKYVLNRMHAAAMGDTLGIGCCLLGLIVMKGFSFTSLKLLLVIIFLWFSSPVSSHLIARLEVATDEEPQKHYKQLAADANGEMTVLSERDREDKTEEEKEARNGAVL